MSTAPKEKEELIIYLAAAKEAISAVLMTERDGKQIPIYFINYALQGREINYAPMEKLILALIPSNPKVTGRLLKWSFKLGEHDIHYRPRTLVKGQILADFIMERLEDDSPDTPMEDKEELSDPCILFTDGSSCIDGSGADLILTNPKGVEFTYALRFKFDATNNEAEYEAVIAGLRIAEQMEEISHVLWAHRTMIKSSNRETPFSLTYGTKAVIPVEIGMPTLRTVEDDMIKNDEALKINLDLLEEKREQAGIQEAKRKAKMEKYYNAKVRNTSFKPGDLVYRNNKASHAEDGGKLRPKWEGPYKLTEALGKVAYKLKDRKWNILPRTWNVCNLKNAMCMKCKHSSYAR
nr:reverse transcriptase domain-containing protein [Tanacetum cinerariifolium]